MAALDPQARIAILERDLQSAHFRLEWANVTIQKRDAQIRLLEERLRQRRIQVLGPHSETLSDLQLELLAEEEPGATSEEVEAEARRQALPQKPSRERKPHPGRRPLPENLPRQEEVIRCADANCATCGGETSLIGYDESEQLDHEPARWFVRVVKREKRAWSSARSARGQAREARVCGLFQAGPLHAGDAGAGAADRREGLGQRPRGDRHGGGEVL